MVKHIHWKLKDKRGRNIGILDAVYLGKSHGVVYCESFKFTPYVPKTRAKKEPEPMPKHLEPMDFEDNDSDSDDDDSDFESDEPRLAARPMHRF